MSKTKSFFEQHSIDAIHVHDLPLANTGLAVAKKYGGCRMVLDLHENYPEGLKVWFQKKKSFIINLKNRLFFAYDRWHQYEKEMCQKADVVVAVVEEMKSRLIAIHGLDPNKVKVVSNTEPLSFLTKKSESNILDEYQDSFVIAYAGGLGPHRGLETAIDGMVAIRESIPEAKLLIYGSGSNDYVASLKRLVESNGLQQHVLLKGRIPFEDVWGVMTGAQVNIIPHFENDHTNNTIPHKLFQIMSSGRPLLVSSCQPLKRIVGSAFGFVHQADNPNDFAEQTLKIHKDFEGALGKAERAKEEVRQHCNWELDAQELNKIYL